MDEACTIKLEHIQNLLQPNEIAGIFLYHHEKNIAKEYPNDTDTITYTVLQKGTYSIYAVTGQGTTINLNSYILIEYDTDYEIEENQNSQTILQKVKLPTLELWGITF